MGKKIDLNSPRSTSDLGIKRTRPNHNFSRPTSNGTVPNNQNIDENEASNGENTQSSPNKKNQKATEMGLRAAGVPKGFARMAARNERTYQLADKVNAVVTFPKKAKFVISIILICLPFIFLLFFVTLFSDLINSKNKFGIGGYPYYEDACKEVMVNNNLIDIEEYVAGVISREVPGFPPETLKAMAVTARTYVIHNAERVGDDPDSCYYNVKATDDTFQVYTQTQEETYVNATNETRGLIITRNGSLATGHYDASCIYTASAAKNLDPSGNYNENNYYIKYGEWTLGGGIYFQAIPKDIAPSVGSFNYFFRPNHPCYGNHGGGMSQNGSLYLEKYEYYTWNQIIDFYYNGEAEIMSIYPSYGGYGGEYPIDPNNELYKNLHFLAGTSIESVVSSAGSSMEEFNSNISSAVQSAGYGTRDGTVAAAVTLIGSTAQMGYKINYEWGGGHEGYSLGAASYWGTAGEAYCSSHPQPNQCYQIYRWDGLDCSGFVKWVIYNGTGKQLSINDLFGRTGIGTTKRLSSSKAVCQPGDALYSDGHVVFVVGLNDDTNNYIVAEAAGYAGYGINPRTDTSIYGGVKLSNFGYAKSGYRCLDLSDIY